MENPNRSIHEMLKDTPPMNESSNAVQTGSIEPKKHPTSLPLKSVSGKKFMRIHDHDLRL